MEKDKSPSRNAALSAIRIPRRTRKKNRQIWKTCCQLKMANAVDIIRVDAGKQNSQSGQILKFIPNNYSNMEMNSTQIRRDFFKMCMMWNIGIQLMNYCLVVNWWVTCFWTSVNSSNGTCYCGFVLHSGAIIDDFHILVNTTFMAPSRLVPLGPYHFFRSSVGLVSLI